MEINNLMCDKICFYPYGKEATSMRAINSIKRGLFLKTAFKFVLVLSCLLCAPLGLAQTSTDTQNPGHLVVSFIDVGQGDSILVEFPNDEVMLVDAGPTEMGQTVVRYLRSREIDNIDILVATHPHDDHIGGMLDVLGAFSIGKVWDSGYNHGSQAQENFLALIQSKGIQFGTPRAGFFQEIGDARIEILAPGEFLLSGTDSDPNNNSIVMLVTYGGISFLLTGDMQGEERQTRDSWPECTVLKVAHHGSANGTDANFLTAVSPEVAVVSYGLDNSYGHPAQETRNLLRQNGCAVKSTASNGTITISTDGKTFEITTTRGPAVTTTVAPTPPTSSGGGSGNYIGNRNSHIFHRPSCSYLPNLENRIYFSTRESAIAAGYQPCQRCNP